MKSKLDFNVDETMSCIKMQAELDRLTYIFVTDLIRKAGPFTGISSLLVNNAVDIFSDKARDSYFAVQRELDKKQN